MVNGFKALKAFDGIMIPETVLSVQRLKSGRINPNGKVDKGNCHLREADVLTIGLDYDIINEKDTQRKANISMVIT